MMTYDLNFRKFLRRSACAAIALLGASSLPAQVTQVNYASLTGTEFISFDGVAGDLSPGTHL